MAAVLALVTTALALVAHVLALVAELTEPSGPSFRPGAGIAV